MTQTSPQMPGTIGPYQLLSKLGAGGMGEVYRARDPRLGRDVAIKVLPEAFALDADRLSRFTREAQLLEAARVRLGLPRKLFNLPLNAGVWLPAKDGQRLLVNMQAADPVPAPMTVVVNWAKGLAR